MNVHFVRNECYRSIALATLKLDRTVGGFLSGDDAGAASSTAMGALADIVAALAGLRVFQQFVLCRVGGAAFLATRFHREHRFVGRIVKNLFSNEFIVGDGLRLRTRRNIFRRDARLVAATRLIFDAHCPSNVQSECGAIPRFIVRQETCNTSLHVGRPDPRRNNT
jgi:hypothetical protein